MMAVDVVCCCVVEDIFIKEEWYQVVQYNFYIGVVGMRDGKIRLIKIY